MSLKTTTILDGQLIMHLDQKEFIKASLIVRLPFIVADLKGKDDGGTFHHKSLCRWKWDPRS